MSNIPNQDLLRASFLKKSWQSIHPLVKQWLPALQIRSILAEELEVALVRLEDIQFATSFQQYCPIKGANTNDYFHRLIPLERCGCVLTGIRFKGCNTALPFVEVLAQDFPLDSADKLHCLINGIRKEFAVFSPLWVRLRLGDHQQEIPLKLYTITPDLRYFAAPIALLQQQEYPKSYDAIKLERCIDTGFYPRYQVVHDNFRADSTTLADEVSPSSVEDFENCITNGYVFEVYLQGQWVGVIAVWRESDYGMSGYCIEEYILKSEFRGLGFGAAMLRHLIDRLENESNVLLFGHIHPLNLASCGAARRAGLIEIGGYIFVA